MNACPLHSETASSFSCTYVLKCPQADCTTASAQEQENRQAEGRRFKDGWTVDQVSITLPFCHVCLLLQGSLPFFCSGEFLQLLHRYLGILTRESMPLFCVAQWQTLIRHASTAKNSFFGELIYMQMVPFYSPFILESVLSLELIPE